MWDSSTGVGAKKDLNISRIWDLMFFFLSYKVLVSPQTCWGHKITCIIFIFSLTSLFQTKNPKKRLEAHVLCQLYFSLRNSRFMNDGLCPPPPFVPGWQVRDELRQRWLVFKKTACEILKDLIQLSRQHVVVVFSEIRLTNSIALPCRHFSWRRSSSGDGVWYWNL